ncbi:hypothetical protein [Streptomyces lincolnensis]|uniref:hypothetical protein n=1 Tax=Streptomyces lincolnensis TaxID=1915 RepID=UPI00083297D8|nr:hypothetical protein [Streptomyces lincolnensis]QMV06760.1 hypothetical protein GJU35_14455 [Streptomyces lincolnensis]
MRARSTPAATPAVAGSSGEDASTSSPRAAANSSTAGSTASRTGIRLSPSAVSSAWAGSLTGWTASGAPDAPRRIRVSTIR